MAEKTFWTEKASMKKIILILTLTLISLTACQAPLATIPARKIDAEKITLGSAQSKIKVGSTGEVVIDALGSHNIVTSNPDGSETWVYDKTSSDNEYAKDWFTGTGVTAKSSRTMMVVIKFDIKKLVKDIKYRQTTY